MDYVTRQFINLTKKFRKELRLLILKLNSALDKQTEAIREATKSDHSQQAPPEITSLLNSVETIKRNYDTQQTNEERWQKRTFWVSLAGVLILLIYTIYTGRMYYANRDAADAALRAAEIANEAVHLSERAYITTVPPDLVLPQKSVSFVISNNGRMPSGIADIIVHWFTVPIVDPHSNVIDLATAIDKHWQQKHVTSVPPGNPLVMKFPVSKVDENVLKVGHQQVIIVGFVTYNDGFPDTPTQRWQFCAMSGYHTTMKVVYMTPCDADQILHAAELADGYPNNEDHD